MRAPNAAARRGTPESPSDGFDLAGRFCGDLNALEDFAGELDRRSPAREQSVEAAIPPRRINADQTTLEKDLAKLVLSLIDVVRRLMERQAVRRVNAGSLSEDEVERLGETFLKLDRRMTELRTVFGLEAEDLNLNLGPIHDLI